jgi:anti-sigma factor RsiW
MSDQQRLRAWHWNDPAQEEARQAQHELLIDLLSAYVDEELPPETVSQLDAHLVGCARCRREVQLQLSLRDALAQTPVVPARPSLRDRIIATTTALPPAPVGGAPALPGEADAGTATAARADDVPAGRPVARRRLLRWVVAGVVAVAGVGGWIAWHASAPAPPIARITASARSVPLFEAVAADYRRLGGADLPGPARDLEAIRSAVGVPIQPLTGPAVHLLGAWTTTLEGQPAAVLAYRWDDRLIVQYIVPDQLFFRHPVVRAAAATHRPVGATDGTVGIVAWPVTDAGSVLVGDGSPERLARALTR